MGAELVAGIAGGRIGRTSSPRRPPIVKGRGEARLWSRRHGLVGEGPAGVRALGPGPGPCPFVGGRAPRRQAENPWKPPIPQGASGGPAPRGRPGENHPPRVGKSRRRCGGRDASADLIRADPPQGLRARFRRPGRAGRDGPSPEATGPRCTGACAAGRSCGPSWLCRPAGHRIQPAAGRDGGG
jgi:hypothetical protein